MGAEITLKYEEHLDTIIDDAVAKGLNDAGIYLVGKLKDNFGRDANGGKVNNVVGKQEYRYKKNAQGEWIRSKEKTRKRFKSERNVYQSSPPGGYPGIRTGKLRQSVAQLMATAGNLVTTIGTNLPYGRHLEYGWVNKAKDGSLSHVPARPWLRRTANHELPAIEETMAKSVRAYLNARLGGRQ